MTDERPGAEPRPSLGLWDAVSIIIGIVVGTSIFKSPPDIFRSVATPGQGLLLWMAGGVLSLLGALCFAELATAYPRSGGAYIYLTRAFGRFPGFLFGWGNLAGILTANIGVMAFVFAEYALRLFGGPSATPVAGEESGRLEYRETLLAMGVVAVLTLLNIIGVRVGRTAQNVLSAAKVIGLLAIVVAGFVAGSEPVLSAGSQIGPGAWIQGLFGSSFAMILVLYAYGGWSDCAFVAAEVRDTQRNIPRALLLGIAAITAIYLLVNIGYLRVLGFQGLRDSSTPAADVLNHWLGEGGQRGMSLLVIASSLGALNGLLFTGSRVNASLGSDHPIFAWLGRWDPRLGTPAIGLIVQGGIALAMIALIGTSEGRAGIDAALTWGGLEAIPWKEYGGGFSTLLSGTAPLFWLFFLLAGLSVFVLRIRDPRIERPFRVPLYPVTPAVFCLTSVGMLYKSLEYAKYLSLLGFVPLALGVLAYFWSEWMRRRDHG